MTSAMRRATSAQARRRVRRAAGAAALQRQQDRGTRSSITMHDRPQRSGRHEQHERARRAASRRSRAGTRRARAAIDAAARARTRRAPRPSPNTAWPLFVPSARCGGSPAASSAGSVIRPAAAGDRVDESGRERREHQKPQRRRRNLAHRLDRLDTTRGVTRATRRGRGTPPARARSAADSNSSSTLRHCSSSSQPTKVQKRSTQAWKG